MFQSEYILVNLLTSKTYYTHRKLANNERTQVLTIRSDIHELQSINILSVCDISNTTRLGSSTQKMI